MSFPCPSILHSSPPFFLQLLLSRRWKGVKEGCEAGVELCRLIFQAIIFFYAGWIAVHGGELECGMLCSQIDLVTPLLVSLT